MKKTALITGASSGIGMATAREFARKGINLILCGRRQERLDTLKNELVSQTKVQTLAFDVRDKDAVFEQINSLPSSFKRVDILINNAGNAHGLAPPQGGAPPAGAPEAH